jgi:hypothetical protein
VERRRARGEERHRRHVAERRSVVHVNKEMYSVRL